MSLYDVLISTPSAIIGANALREIIYVTAAVRDALGWEPDELMGKNLDVIIPSQYRKAHKEAFQKFIKSGTMSLAGRPVRTFALNKKGEEIAVEITLGSYRTEDGDLRVIAMIRDIRDYIELQEEGDRLRHELTYVRSITYNLAEGLIAIDTKGNVKMMNPAAEKLIGYNEEELLGKNAHDVIHCWNPDGTYQPRSDCEILSTFKDKEIRHVPDDYFRRKDGTFVNIAFFASPIYRGGEVTGVIVTFQDISERKASQNELLQSEKLYRQVVESSNDMVALLESSGVIVFANQPAHFIALGYAGEELVGINVRDIVHPDDIGNTEESQLLELIRTQERTPLRVSRIKHKDGHWVWVEGSGSFIVRDGKSLFLTASRNLTASRAYEAEMRGLLESIPDLIWIADSDGTINHYNSQWLRVTGLELSQLQQRELYVHPDDNPIITKKWNHAFKNKEQFETEVRYKMADGSYRWYLARANPIVDDNGNILRWVGTSTDIDIQRRAEEYQARLAAIVDSSNDAILGKTLDGVITSFNEAAEQLYGYTAEEAIGKNVSILVPEEKLIELEGIMFRLSRGEPVDHLVTVRKRKDDTKIKVRVSISPIKNKSGKVIGASSTARRIE
jgi:PAS domain S-box-containing protein